MRPVCVLRPIAGHSVSAVLFACFSQRDLHDLITGRVNARHLTCSVASQVAGTSGKVRLDGDDDAEGASTEEQGAAILAAFGITRRNEVRWPHTAGSSSQEHFTMTQ